MVLKNKEGPQCLDQGVTTHFEIE
ncbi:uncharacterized protein G2W53_022447 [Senna tora]|uniref:Uncharacterized protein n=1 Tax=Senna tora TaxID=362788 RepID=A0A834TL91_9FABA|nr:uncharacterized protein G2W53_022447 [Senna tora]